MSGTDGVERRFRSAVLLFTDFTDSELAMGEYGWIHLTLHEELEIDTIRWSDGSRVAYHRPKGSSALWIDLDGAPEGAVELTVDYHRDILTQEPGLWVRVPANRTWFPVHRDDRPIPYRVAFHRPDRLRVASVGSMVSESREGKEVTTVWRPRQCAR